MAQAFLDEIHRPVPNGTWSKLPHSTICRHNLTDSNLEVRLSDPVADFKTNYHSTFHDITCPFPIFKPDGAMLREINGYDSCLELVRHKLKWEIMRENLIQSCRKTLSAKVWDSVKSLDVTPGDSITLPVSMLYLSKHLSEDPDKTFTGMYNWYYSGSNLSMINVEEEKFLIHMSGMTEKCIYFTRVLNEKGEWNPDVPRNMYSVGWPDSQPVYELDVKNDKFVIRQRHKLSFMQINPKSNDVCINCEYSVESNAPFVSVSICNKSFDKMCSLDTDKIIRIYDIVCTSLEMEDTISPVDGEIDKWGQVKFFDNTSILYVDRKRVGIFDTRVRMDQFCQVWPCVGEECNIFSSCCMSNKGLVYLGTRHYCLVLDERKGYKMCWTHNLPHYPTVMKTHISEAGTETLFLGSQRSDNIHVCTIQYADEEVSSISPVKSIYSPRWTLFSARRNNQLTSKYVSSRFTACLTGLHCFEMGDGIGVLRLTSMGDVFIQTIRINTKSQDFKIDLQPEELLALESWQIMCLHRLCSSTHSVFASSSNPSRSSLTDRLYDEIKDYLERPNESPEDSEIEDENWKITKQQLVNYCDFLAPRLLKYWDIDSLTIQFSDENIHVADLPSSDDDVDLNERVTQWMERSIHVPPESEDELSNEEKPRDKEQESKKKKLKMKSIPV